MESAIQCYPAGKSPETKILCRNDVGKQVLQDLTVCDSKRKDTSYVEETIMLIARPDLCVATVVHCLMDMGKRRKHGHKEYAEKYASIQDTATK